MAEQRRGREGSRWVNERPSGEDVSAWFKDNVILHDDALKHEHYVQGVTLIPQKAKENEIVDWDEATGKPILDERENLYYIPYVKVETRVKYFWDYVALKDEWLGVLEPVPPTKPIETLPPGFGRLSVMQEGQKGVANFITCTMRATIFKRETVKEIRIVNGRTGVTTFHREGEIIAQGAPGTKMVPTLGRYGADINSIMKAETGAVGRALGLLGMLVVPGSGVATAEDMQEAIAAEGLPTRAVPAAEDAVLEAQSDAQLKGEVTRLIGELGAVEGGDALVKEFRTWVKGRGIAGINEASSAQLRGLVTKLTSEIENATSAPEVEADGAS